MRPICLEFDDYCDATVEELGRLEALKSKCKGLQVTLFTIPQRCSASTIAKAKAHDWIHLAPHGWRHTKGECLSWNDEEAEEKISAASAMGIDSPVFRAPGWLLDGDVYEACKRLGYVVATHSTYRIPSTGVKEYVYNYRLPGFKWYGASHGHLTRTPYITNYIGDMLETGQLDFHPDTEFILPTAAAKVIRDENTVHRNLL